MARTYLGRTENAAGPILGAKFWKKGTVISGEVLRAFKTENGTCYTLQLDKEITANGEDVYPEQKGKITSKQFSVGSLKGFEMAIQSSGLSELRTHDKVEIRCTGTTPTDKGNPLVNFEISVQREDF